MLVRRQFVWAFLSGLGFEVVESSNTSSIWKNRKGIILQLRHKLPSVLAYGDLIRHSQDVLIDTVMFKEDFLNALKGIKAKGLDFNEANLGFRLKPSEIEKEISRQQKNYFHMVCICQSTGTLKKDNVIDERINVQQTLATRILACGKNWGDLSDGRGKLCPSFS